MLGKGLLDRISGMDKKSGIETATRLFSPQVILCDEIGSEEEANALISSCTGGTFVFASCHGRSLEEAQKMKHLKALFESNLFDKAITIKRSANKTYQRTLIFKDLK